MSSTEQELLDLSDRLLKSIDEGDWETYVTLCDEGLTCFEPEAEGHLVSGMLFHKFYFDLPGGGTPRLSSISSPFVRVLGETALVCYTRLIQKVDAHGAPHTVCVNETRVWQKLSGTWKHIHFHRSTC